MGEEIEVQEGPSRAQGNPQFTSPESIVPWLQEVQKVRHGVRRNWKCVQGPLPVMLGFQEEGVPGCNVMQRRARMGVRMVRTLLCGGQHGQGRGS